MIAINLPFPVSLNAIYRNVPGRGRVKTERYRTWLQAAGWDIKQQKPERIKGPYQITMLVQRKDKRKRDLSNLIKGVSDLLVTHQIIEDDSLEQRVVMEWSADIEGCRVVLEPFDA